MATRCGCSGASCSCYVQAGANITVGGVGSLGSPYIITANTATLAELDTQTVNMTVSSGPNYVVSADVIVSPTAGNSLVATASGLFVPTPVIPTFTNGNGIAPIVGGVIQACLSTDAGNDLSFGADGCLYAPTPTAAVPVTVTDTATVDLTLAGQNISADVIISPDAGNTLVAHANGLFVPASTLTNGNGIGPIVGGVISACLSTDANNALSFGTDGCLFTPSSAGTPVTVTALDTATIDTVVTGGPNYVVSGNVKLSTTAGNILTADATGLLLTCASVLACAPAVTVTDTNSVNLTLTGQALSADVIRDPSAQNLLSIGAAGVLVDLVTGCGLSGIRTAASPLIVPSIAWPFACTESNGVDVYCDPATGMLVTDPEKFYLDQVVRSAFTSVADINTIAAVGGPNTAWGPITNLVVTNPSPCRSMNLRVTFGLAHMNMRMNNSGRGNVLVGSQFSSTGAIATPVQLSNAHSQWMRDQTDVGGEADNIFDSPIVDIFPAVFSLPAGATATFSVQANIQITNYDAGMVISLSNIQPFIRVEGYNI